MNNWLRRRLLYRYDSLNYGYTIVELLVVLAVMGTMFSVAIAAFSGRQSRMEFTQAVRDYEAMLQGIINDVGSGYYSSDSFTCKWENEMPKLTVGPGSTTGSNGDCIFLGKALRPSGSDNVIETVIGARTLAGGIDNDSIFGVIGHQSTNADPCLAACQYISVAKQLDATKRNSFQLRVEKVITAEGSHTDINWVLFSFATEALTGGIINNSKVNVIAFKESPFTEQLDAYSPGLMGLNIHHVDGESGLSEVLPPADDFGLIFCLVGNNGQRAEIAIPGDSLVISADDMVSTINTGDSCNGA